MIEDFGRFGTAGRSSYLKTRARIRRAMAVDSALLDESGRERSEAPVPATGIELGKAARKLRFGAFTEPMITGKTLGVDPRSIATAFATRIRDLERQLWDLVESPLGRIAAKIELRAEVGLVLVAIRALNSIVDGEDALESQCEDLRQELEQLQSVLCRSGEDGSTQQWKPRQRRAAE